MCSIYLFEKDKEQSHTRLFHIKVAFALKCLSPRSTSFTWCFQRRVTGVVQRCSVLLHWPVHMFLCDPASMEKNRFTNQFSRNHPGLSFHAHVFPSSVWLRHIHPHWTHSGQTHDCINVIKISSEWRAVSELGETQTFVQGSEALHSSLCLLKA